MAVSVAGEFVVIIVGAGPAGLAAEVYINKRYEEWAERDQIVLPALETKIFEKSDVTAPLWRKYTYDNLTLQCTKSECVLHDQPYREGCPTYPTKDNFIDYLNDYVTKLKNDPLFNTEVMEAAYSEDRKKWEITTLNHTTGHSGKDSCDFLVVASGLNAVPRIPDLNGLATNFPPGERVDPKDTGSPMKQLHSSDYKNGQIYSGKKVLVVGCGDSGIDICGDLFNNEATPYIVVNRRARNGASSFNKRTEKFYKRALEGNEKIDWPYETNLSDLSMEVGNRGQCVNGNIDPKCSIKVKAYSDIESFGKKSVKFYDLVDPVDIDCVILATGYDHNVNKWLKLGAEITFNKTGDLKVDDALGDSITSVAAKDDNTHSFESRIRAIGFNSNSGILAINSAVEETYDVFEGKVF